MQKQLVYCMIYNWLISATVNRCINGLVKAAYHIDIHILFVLFGTYCGQKFTHN